MPHPVCLQATFSKLLTYILPDQANLTSFPQRDVKWAVKQVKG